jgi:hypothetical protein
MDDQLVIQHTEDISSQDIQKRLENGPGALIVRGAYQDNALLDQSQVRSSHELKTKATRLLTISHLARINDSGMLSTSSPKMHHSCLLTTMAMNGYIVSVRLG